MSPKNKTIKVYGERGEQVRVYVEGDLVRVRWRDHGIRKTRSWGVSPEAKAEAKAFAEGIIDARKHPVVTRAPLTLRELWEQYAEAEFPALRPTSQRRYAERWQKWERFHKRETIAEAVDEGHAERYRAARAGLGIAVNQIAEEIKMAKVVHAWGHRRRLLSANYLTLYQFKIKKEDRPALPAEYRMADFHAILAQFKPDQWGQWRPWAALTVLGYQGVRTNALLHLQWADVTDGVLTWRAEWDKLGREWTQPIRSETARALEVCRQWRATLGYTGPWVFFTQDERKVKAGKPAIYGASALAAALKKAEKAAAVAHLDLRAMHGLRRMVAGEVARVTGNPLMAAQFIGDTDLRVVQRSYLKRRDDQLRDVATLLDADLVDPKGQSIGNGTTNGEG